MVVVSSRAANDASSNGGQEAAANRGADDAVPSLDIDDRQIREDCCFLVSG